MGDSNKLQLYSYHRSSCAFRVRIGLNLKGLDYEYKAVDLLKGEQNNPEFLKINPIGFVPALVDGDVVLADSFAILMYLEEKYPQHPLLPRDLEKRAINYQAANIVSASIQPLQNLAVLNYIEEKVGPDAKLPWAQKHIGKGFAALERLLEKHAGKYATGDDVYLEQVRRMLRLSDTEEKNVREFQGLYGEAKTSGFGRIFRSPTLFEDMVKCILVCNCQWSRTLSMARALCELQCPTPTETGKHESPMTKFAPITPAKKEPTKRKMNSQQKSRNVAKRCSEIKSAIEAEATLGVDCTETSIDIQEASIAGFVNKPSEKTELSFLSSMGNFPSPKELASLDENFLAKRCNLGYRASRILRLAQGVVEGRVDLRQIEEDSREASLSNYMKLNEQLGEIYGFGPFTRANVLMCLGFYHVIPSDSETLRHLYQVHKKKSTIKNIQQDIESIYGKYEPFQFLVYWSEIWSFYEERFGKMSELPNSRYKLITAANMRCKNGIT